MACSAKCKILEATGSIGGNYTTIIISKGTLTLSSSTSYSVNPQFATDADDYDTFVSLGTKTVTSSGVSWTFTPQSGNVNGIRFRDSSGNLMTVSLYTSSTRPQLPTYITYGYAAGSSGYYDSDIVWTETDMTAGSDSSTYFQCTFNYTVPYEEWANATIRYENNGTLTVTNSIDVYQLQIYVNGVLVGTLSDANTSYTGKYVSYDPISVQLLLYNSSTYYPLKITGYPAMTAGTMFSYCTSGSPIFIKNIWHEEPIPYVPMLVAMNPSTDVSCGDTVSVSWLASHPTSTNSPVTYTHTVEVSVDEGEYVSIQTINSSNGNSIEYVIPDDCSTVKFRVRNNAANISLMGVTSDWARSSDYRESSTYSILTNVVLNSYGYVNIDGSWHALS